MFCEQMTFAHVAEATHRVLVAPGGTHGIWRPSDTPMLASHGGSERSVPSAVCSASQRDESCPGADPVDAVVVQRQHAAPLTWEHDRPARGASVIASDSQRDRQDARAT